MNLHNQNSLASDTDTQLNSLAGHIKVHFDSNNQ